MDSAFALAVPVNRTVIVAHEQKQGRGRLDRPWCSESGGLYTSIVLTDFDPDIPYSMLASHALYGTIQELGVEARLKWVNDVLCGKNRKIAGVLTEERGGISVIGMGVNVNNREFPPGIREHATSLYLESGKQVDIVDYLCSILECFFPMLDRAHNGEIEDLLANWEEEADLKGRRVKLTGEHGDLFGIARGINRKNGALHLMVDTELKEVYEGSLFYLD
jgi:BirA family biotin operon repressor/biotin-[acetyl-CoA-carboxylase] ligase